MSAHYEVMHGYQIINISAQTEYLTLAAAVERNLNWAEMDVERLS